jgi:GT2 family glycosyltransferase
VVDAKLFELWQYSNGHDLEEICRHFNSKGHHQDVVRAGLACLAEAGLLSRSEEVNKQSNYPKVSDRLVSIVIVNHNSLNWLQECLSSVVAQTYEPIEIILVDNGSIESPANWVRNNFPKVDFIQLPAIQSLAAAINRGVDSAHGDYFLILNPDVRLEPNSVAELVAVASRDASCAVVATKLKFWWAPAFLNGLGNHVPAFRWGTDIGLGHLDLGQFDAWEKVPSACFAAALIRKSAYEVVGALDEGFPLY